LNIKETVCEDTNGKKLNKSGGFLWFSDGLKLHKNERFLASRINILTIDLGTLWTLCGKAIFLETSK
jgi:hypothetical protein